MKIGIIGIGAMGEAVIKNVVLKYNQRLGAVFIYDIDADRVKQLKKKFKWLKQAKSLEEIVKKSDFLMEAASVDCVKKLIPLIRRYKRDILFMSTGGLLGRGAFLKQSEENGVEVIIPHGAVAGLDAIKTVRLAGIKSLTISSYKPVRSLLGSPYLVKNKINLKSVRGKRLVFQGGVEEAIKGFPRSINVSATLLLVSGLKDLNVRIYACKGSKNITHVIDVKSAISDLQFVCRNYPSRENPRTSALAVYSACECMRQYFSKYLNK